LGVPADAVTLRKIRRHLARLLPEHTVLRNDMAHRPSHLDHGGIEVEREPRSGSSCRIFRLRLQTRCREGLVVARLHARRGCRHARPESGRRIKSAVTRCPLSMSIVRGTPQTTVGAMVWIAHRTLVLVLLQLGLSVSLAAYGSATAREVEANYSATCEVDPIRGTTCAGFLIGSSGRSVSLESLSA
jgi:hypothetical protein